MNTVRQKSAVDVGKPGDFFIYPSIGRPEEIFYLYIWLPNEKGPGTWRLRKVTDMARPLLDERTWNWDGDMDLPTVVPSLHHIGVYHGTWTRGVLNDAGSA